MEKWIGPAGNGVLEGRVDCWKVISPAIRTLGADSTVMLIYHGRKLLSPSHSIWDVGVKTKRLLSIPYILVFIIRKEMQNRADKREGKKEAFYWLFSHLVLLCLMIVSSAVCRSGNGISRFLCKHWRWQRGKTHERWNYSRFSLTLSEDLERNAI